MLPRMVSVPIEPLTFTYFTIVAAGLGAGSVSSLNFGLDYQVLPVSLIGVSFSLAVFPILSAAFADGDRRGLPLGPRAVTSSPSRVLTTVAAVALFVLSGMLVEVLLGGGKFGPDDVARTSAVVAAFALSIPFDALAYPLSRGLYATHDTLRQVVASFAGLAVVVIVDPGPRRAPRHPRDPARLRRGDDRQGRAPGRLPRRRGSAGSASAGTP